MSLELAPGRTTVFASTARVRRPRVAGHIRARATGLRMLTGDALGVYADTLLPEDPRRECTPDHLASLARVCASEAQAVTGADDERARNLLLLALDLQQLALDLHEEDLLQRNRRLGDCADGLARLRGLPSSRDLIDVVCQELVNRCDFGRATISGVNGGTWKPQRAFFADADASWFAEWVGQGIPLHGQTPEARLLTERQPALILDTAMGPVHQDIIVESGQSRSYVVAPLMSRGAVVGFFHCDHFPTERQANDVDRDVLWAFAEGFGRVHERLILMERIQNQRAEVGGVLDSAFNALPEALGATPRPRILTAGQERALADLTAREAQVLELMVGGSTNGAIAARLVIAEDTVKSHVKQILRKLGVANRAKAIACAAGTAPA